MVTIAKVRRPLGVILEEREGGRTSRCWILTRAATPPAKMSWSATACSWSTPRKIARTDDFDTVAGRIAGATVGGDRVELTLGRRVGTVRIIWPNGVQSGALPGEPLRELA